MEFINRKKELAFLNNKWRENKPQLIIIYGKRRVGKTELALRFAEKKPHIYFLCEKIPIANQLKKLTKALGNYFHDEFLPESGFNNWETFFKYLRSKNEKLVLIIDEFPYLVETDASVPASFQKGWDLYLKDSQVYLILSGSSISMMEQSVLFPKSPLYGRRTGQFFVKPFKFKEVRKMFPSKDFEEILSIYGVVGGTALYLNKFKGKSFMMAVKEEILRKGQPLYEEVEFLLREELREPRNYFAILEALSLGKHKLSEIINETGFDKGMVSRYIAILNNLQITKKEIPITEKIPEKTRKGIYIIEDNFFNFWFRLIFRHRYLLEEGKINKVADKLKELLPRVLSVTYEKIAGEILFENIAKGKISAEFENYGRWWDKNNEIDLVAVNKLDNEILFGEAKWSNKKLGTNIYTDLKMKSEKLKWGRPNRKEYFALFGKAGFTDDMMTLAGKQKNLFLFKEDKLIGS